MAKVLPLPMLQPDPLKLMLDGCRKDDRASQEKLYRHCYPEMIKVCMRYAVDPDGAAIIFNNAMLRVFRTIKNYHDQGKLMAWVRTITVNCCLDFVKDQVKTPAGILTDVEDSIGIPPEVFDLISAKDIREIIHQLPRTTSIVFNLFVYEGLTHKQISKALNIAEGTSKWHVSEGRSAIKLKLQRFLQLPTPKNAIQ